MTKLLLDPRDATPLVRPSCPKQATAEAVSLDSLPVPTSRPPQPDVGALPLDIVGPDNRQQAPNGSVPPWSLICHLILQDGAGRNFMGTGWLAGPSTVFTAAHNLWDGRVGYEAFKVWVVPGREGNVAPHGFAISQVFQVHPQWKATHRTQFDVAAIHLPVSYEHKVGYFGFGAYSDAVLSGIDAQVSGYPEDKPLGTQWHDSSRLRVSVAELAYTADTMRGHSGSPVYQFDEQGRPIAVGIHTDGNVTHNVGVRISPLIHGLLKSWWR